MVAITIIFTMLWYNKCTFIACWYRIRCRHRLSRVFLKETHIVTNDNRLNLVNLINVSVYKSNRPPQTCDKVSCWNRTSIPLNFQRSKMRSCKGSDATGDPITVKALTLNCNQSIMSWSDAFSNPVFNHTKPTLHLNSKSKKDSLLVHFYRFQIECR